MINTMSKIRGQEKGPGYPQAEALLAEAMLKFGRELGDDCNFGNGCFLILFFLWSLGTSVPLKKKSVEDIQAIFILCFRSNLYMGPNFVFILFIILGVICYNLFLFCDTLIVSQSLQHLG